MAPKRTSNKEKRSTPVKKHKNEENTATVAAAVKTDHTASLSDNLWLDVLERTNHDDLDELSVLNRRLFGLTEAARRNAVKFAAQRIYVRQQGEVCEVIVIWRKDGVDKFCHMIQLATGELKLLAGTRTGVRRSHNVCAFPSNMIPEAIYFLLAKFTFEWCDFKGVPLNDSSIDAFKRVVICGEIKYCEIDCGLSDEITWKKFAEMILDPEVPVKNFSITALPSCGIDLSFLNGYADKFEHPNLEYRNSPADWGNISFIIADAQLNASLQKFVNIVYKKLVVDSAYIIPQLVARMRQKRCGCWYFQLTRSLGGKHDIEPLLDDDLEVVSWVHHDNNKNSYYIQGKSRSTRDYKAKVSTISEVNNGVTSWIISMPITDTDRHIIWAGIVVFNVFGLFGNLNIIFAHYRLKALRTKYGILLTLLVISQTICLLYELVDLAYDVSGVTIVRKTCFYIISPYIFTNCLQTALMAALSTDMLISIAAPLRHRSLRFKPYLTMLVVPGLIYGIVTLTLGVLNMDYEVIKLCQPPASLPFDVTRVWYFIGLLFTATTIVSYIAAFSIICYKCSTNKDQLHIANSNIERKALKSLSVIIIAFIFERLIFLFLVNLLDFFGHSKDVIERVQAYMVFSSLAVYSSTFYMCFARSSEYRRIFWRQIAGIFRCCGVNEYRFGTSSVDLRKPASNKFQPDVSYGNHPELPKSSKLPSLNVTAEEGNSSVMVSLSIVLALISTGYSSQFDHPNKVASLPGAPLFPEFNLYSGFLNGSFANETDISVFYVLAEAIRVDPSTAPLLLWFNGGPGSSSLAGFFLEHGPYRVTEEGDVLTYNEFSWNQYANVLYLESPLGVGFTQREDGGMTNNDKDAAEINYHALRDFMERVHPEYAERSYFLSGQSYAGAYVPHFALRLMQGITSGEMKNGNFKGFAIGNPVIKDDLSYHVSQALQFLSYGFAPLRLTKEVFDAWLKHERLAERSIKGEGLTEYDISGTLEFVINKTLNEYIMWNSPVNYNFAQHCYEDSPANEVYHVPVGKFLFACYAGDSLEFYMNRVDVQVAFHVTNFTTGTKNWTSINLDMADNSYERDTDVTDVYTEIFNLVNVSSFRVLIYSGDTDVMVPSLLTAHGASVIAKRNDLDEQVQETGVWRFFGDFAGGRTLYRKGNITMDVLTVRGAGHSVPTDLPAQAFQMINNFLFTEDNQFVNYTKPILKH